MKVFNTLFQATSHGYNKTGSLYIGKVVALTVDEALARALMSLGEGYEMLGICEETASTIGHGKSLRSIVPPPLPTPPPPPTPVVDGDLNVSDL